eukprot:CAMPEP_0184044488 /NCGR_PEP_ID=MMETSP0956-20121227/311_1 /TAXON_ID=627963 /ORGANISM="Aplanochytrium sp, Strain PBS07" /LENGTH=112 /DNA_ID=CAMNT_0026335531 /DNA_START=817 /DNA_END=1155 /DNA_ORIENTATION=+
MGTLVFAIVGRDDLVYETEFTSPASSSVTESGTTSASDSAHLHQFVMHSALDVVEEKMWETTNMYLKTVDNFNDMNVYAWVTASGAKFYSPDQPIRSQVFQERVHTLGRKLL